MFQALFSRLFPQRSKRDRLIFRYHVGRETRFADPMVLARRMEEVGGENWPQLVATVDRLRQPLPPAMAASVSAELLAKRERDFSAALMDLVRIVREVFSLPVLQSDGTGVTDSECIELLSEYLLYSRGLANAARPLAN